jgi:hypothetical protein
MMVLFNNSSYIYLSILILPLLVLTGCTDSGSSSSVTGADPGVLEAPIAFVKRPVPVDDNGDEIQSDLREPLFFAEGGDVYLRSNSTVTATETNITRLITAGQGDVKDLKPSFDGTRLLFTLRQFDPNPNDDDIPTWNIYEYNLQEKSLRCIIDDVRSTVECDGFKSEEGDDVGPAYLPDGRIIFSSNRQRQSGEMLTNEGKPRFKALDEDEDTAAMVLHVMNDDGGELHQISFNQSHDLDPAILTNSYSGEVMFTRWDNAAGNNAMHLYKINPDGTELQVLYGVHSHNTGTNNTDIDDSTIQFSQPEEMEDGRIMVISRPYSGTYGGGNITIIDIDNFVNNDQPVYSMTGLTGLAQSSATINDVSSADELSLAGRYSAAYPLWDGSNRVLVSKSTCELIINDVKRACIEPYLSNVDAEEASPSYSIWLYDMNNDSQKIIVNAETGTVITDIVALQSRPTPVIKTEKTLDPVWVEDGIGTIHIQSVYDFGNSSFDGCFTSDCTDATGINSVNDLGDPMQATADQRPARFVRFVKAVSLPDEDDPDLGNNAPDLDRAAFGPLRNQAMREIIGYAPVEPDGSVKVKVPANIPLAINILDKNGRRISARHQNWFQVKAGDTMECTGCHTHTTANGVTPNVHHRRDAEAPSINAGVPASGVFANTLVPGTVDRYFGNLGETMAEVRFRLANTSIPPAEEPHVTSDLLFEDYWTDPAARVADTGFGYLYENLETPSPASATCLPTPPAKWNFKCRILINYEQHIHPLWSLTRDNGIVDNTCTNCHTNFDTVLMLDKVPDAQLDLTDGFSDQEPEQFKSYRELFSTDQGEVLDAMGVLTDIQIEQTTPILDANGDPVLDINGDPTFNTILINDPNARTLTSMSGNSVRVSYFLEKMTETELNAGRTLTAATAQNYVDHSSFMSADELRLISEWLDIGAQYFNDPFDPDVPMN